jgi:hypothetical protein
MARRWPWWLVAAGGVLMAALWPVYISLHGPTSFNVDREFLGRDPLFWGSMMEGPSSLLVAAGLLALLPAIWMALGRAARIGYVLVLVSLVVPGVVDLVIVAIVPPLLYPVEAVGLALLAGAGGRLHPLTRIVFGVMAALLAATMLQLFLTREQFDALEAYRIHGLMAHVAVGIGWAVAGITEALRPGNPTDPAADLAADPAPERHRS